MTSGDGRVVGRAGVAGGLAHRDGIAKGLRVEPEVGEADGGVRGCLMYDADHEASCALRGCFTEPSGFLASPACR